MKRVFSLLMVLILSTMLSGCTSIFDKNNKSGLQVLTNDIPAATFLDGEYLEKTPYINKELKPGQYLLKIQPDDSKLTPYETTITLRKGLLTVITWKPGLTSELSGGVMYELEKLSSTKQTELSIISIPDGAIVSIDDGEKQFSPVLKTDIAPGSHKISVSLPSYEEQSHTVNVVAGHRLNVSVTLAKNPAESSNDSTSSATAIASATTASGSAQASASATTKSTESNLESVSLKTATASASTGATITITTTNFFQDGKEVLRVRDAIGTSGKELGFAAVGESFPYLNETNAGWYKIDFKGSQGWVSGKYAKLQN